MQDIQLMDIKNNGETICTFIHNRHNKKSTYRSLSRRNSIDIVYWDAVCYTKRLKIPILLYTINIFENLMNKAQLFVLYFML
jgi:hypothetical protein